MGFMLTIGSFIAGVLRKRSKLVAFGILVVLWIVFSLNTYNADYVAYEYLYNNYLIIYAGAGQTIGYQLLVGIATSLGFDFLQFRCIIGFVCLFLLYSFVSRYTKNVAFVLALYVLLPFLYDVVQIRFFLAGCLGIYSMRFLIDGEKYGTLFFVLGVIVSATIHPAVILFLTFLLIKLSDKKLPLVAFALFFLIIIANYLGLTQLLAAHFMDSTKFDVYFDTMSRFGFLTYWISIVLMLVLIRGLDVRKAFAPVNSQLLIGNKDCCDAQKHKKIVRGDAFLRFFHKAMYAYLPLMALIPLSTTNFYRPIRSSLILVYIYFAILMFEKKGCFSKKEITLFVLVFICWFVYTCYFLFSGVWNLVVVDELTNNLLWS